jgi:hypothetical protein
VAEAVTAGEAQREGQAAVVDFYPQGAEVLIGNGHPAHNGMRIAERSSVARI